MAGLAGRRVGALKVPNGCRGNGSMGDGAFADFDEVVDVRLDPEVLLDFRLKKLNDGMDEGVLGDTVQSEDAELSRVRSIVTFSWVLNYRATVNDRQMGLPGIVSRCLCEGQWLMAGNRLALFLLPLSMMNAKLRGMAGPLILSSSLVAIDHECSLC